MAFQCLEETVVVGQEEVVCIAIRTYGLTEARVSAVPLGKDSRNGIGTLQILVEDTPQELTEGVQRGPGEDEVNGLNPTMSASASR